jgi:hypothetical protein
MLLSGTCLGVSLKRKGYCCASCYSPALERVTAPSLAGLGVAAGVCAHVPGDR